MEGFVSDNMLNKNTKACREVIPMATRNGEKINREAITIILLVGELIGDLMPFDGLYSNDYATNNSPSESILKDKSLRLNEVDRSLSTIRPADCYAIYDDIVRGAIESMPDNLNTVMGVSGGRDSRHIALAMKRSGKRAPRMVTARHFLGNASETDVAVAQMLSHRLGNSIEIAAQPNDRFLVEWDKNVLTGMQTLSHSWGLSLASSLNGSEVLLDGMNGGVLFGRAGLLRSVVLKFGHNKPTTEELYQHVISTLFESPLDVLKRWVPSSFISHEILDSIRQRLRECFFEYSDFENPIQAFLYGEHVRRNTQLFTYGLMENEFVACPLDTHKIARFALSLPWSLSGDHRFQDKAISLRYPDFDDLPYAEALGVIPPTSVPDVQSENGSWERIRKILKPHLTEDGLVFLEHARTDLGVIQRSTLLAQALYWQDHGELPLAMELTR